LRIALFAGLGIYFIASCIASAHAEGDPARGKAVFAKCMACHSVEAGRNGVGPTLHGLIGSKAATVPDYRFSPAMQRSGITWDDDNLRKYLADPQALVPGTKMTFVGLPSRQDADDVIAYLKSAAK
jgi:cytochrome c2